MEKDTLTLHKDGTKVVYLSVKM